MNSVWRTVLGLVLRGLFRGTAGSRNKDRKEKDEKKDAAEGQKKGEN